MNLNENIDPDTTYNFNDVVDQIENSGITSICKTINRFNQIMDDNNVSSKNKDLEELVNNDIYLTNEVLKLANSPIFRSVNNNGIDTISNAIKIIGWDNIYKIGMSLTVKGLVKTAKARTFANWLIERSILVSHISDTLLDSIKTHCKELSNIDSIYAQSLLQDIGALGMLQVIKNYQQDVIEIKLLDINKSWNDAEQMLYGFDHNMVGDQVLMRSQLPQSFPLVARYHHEPDFRKYPKTESKKISLIRLAQTALLDEHNFSLHDPFCNSKSMDKRIEIRKYDALPENIQHEIKAQFDLSADIYNEIISTKLTEELVSNIAQQFLN